jgi:hypothetical protein
MTTPAIAPHIDPNVLRTLEEIFLPQAKRHREETFKRQTQPGAPPAEELRFAHYTTAEAALKIINSKRLWMRNSDVMADYREVKHGYGILQKFFSDQERRRKFVEPIDACHPNAANEALIRFDQRWAGIQSNVFIASVSEHSSDEDLIGRLSMWIAFGTRPARVAIVLRVPKLSQGAVALNLMFSPVEYFGDAAVHAAIQEVIANVERNRDLLRSIERQLVVEFVFIMLLAAVACLKHQGFQEEREWRALYFPTFLPSSLIEPKLEVIDGYPQRIYQIPLDAKASPVLADLDFSRIFHRLIIGPSPHSWPMVEAFRESLAAAGVTDPKERIWVSDIPIRTV